jgi:hypothetical protein
MERETRSLKPIKMRITATKARGLLCNSKPLAKGCQGFVLAYTNVLCRVEHRPALRQRLTIPMLSPIINTSACSLMELGFVRKK